MENPEAGMLSIHLEVIPAPGIVDAVRKAVPPSSSCTISITCLPKHGVDATLAVATELAQDGHRVVPHLAAKGLSSRERLREILEECAGAGIAELFVVGGDAGTPDGPYADGEALLRDVVELDGGRFTVGVAGYPEGHPGIPDHVLLESLRRKQEHASRIVTQMCFSAERIGEYVAGLRREGVDLPVRAGVAGAVPTARLLTLAAKIGVGSSLRFLSGKASLARNLLPSSRYAPGEMIARLGRTPDIDSVQLYTFNSLDALPALGSGSAPHA
ncbi:methylenetetrahydrofolate reductase [Arthrobacter sp. Y-9]|uniref:methylenetetrahydrofolate reductase n=1 Tax=Arthrobacter sp. Y-9 TaxID=3039385 RepID=UPI00241FB19D|nr:methylenetetrahydrofolate reductase [Arthrobacter sp. Y-9]WFR84676.1 methylenetetrahydrofolate reductase [Arthrobacter sp. Y-9]